MRKLDDYASASKLIESTPVRKKHAYLSIDERLSKKERGKLIAALLKLKKDERHD